MSEKKTAAETEQPYTFTPQSSVNELKEFQTSHLWRDIEDYIKFRLGGSLEVLKTDPDLKVLYRSQGAVEVAEDILNLPDRMIEWANEEKEIGA